ncbi:MAG: mechanosensitive ion channel [Acidimicrobiia bacterium]|nr:mechanosensitive ion channel [Acidimicrobiia bacterium]
MFASWLFAQSEGRELTDWIPTVIVVASTVALILVARALADRSKRANAADRRFRGQIVTIAVLLLGVLALIFALPDGSDSDLAFSVFGLVVTGALAISSQSIIANAMAGLMLRSVASFKPGDFIELSDHMGRVSEQGLFHTEIQTPDRDLITIPNSVMLNQPVRVVRSSGTIVSVHLSIGYDVSHHVLDDLFVAAAKDVGLVDPFVQMLDLGDHSITYRVAGFLEDPKTMLACRSNLRMAIVDTLSDAGIEIMSPTYIARRAVNNDPLIAAERSPSASARFRRTSEDRVFDKAERAGRLETARADLAAANEELDALRSQQSSAPEDERLKIEGSIGRQERQIERLVRSIEQLTDALNDE